MQETKHTPLPYQYQRISGRDCITTAIDSRNPVNWIVAETDKHNGIPTAEAEANAQFIVRACNSHYELLGTLELIKEGIALKKIADACILNHANNTIETLNEIVSLAIAKAEDK